jgi:putative ABC transport system ATP-binding protein
MIRLIDAHKTFNANNANKSIALNGINLDIINGQFIVLLGSNGSGKSSLLNSISGSFLLDSGQILIDGQNLTNKLDFERSHLIARLFQNPLYGTASELSIIENFRLASLRIGTKKLKIGLTNEFRDKVKERVAILKLGLENRLDTPIGLLSGGQRQALTLLMATMCDTKVLLMDEPVAALDPRSAEIVMSTANEIINKFKITTILVTHRMKDAIEYGNRLIFMNQGKIEKDFNEVEKGKLKLVDIINWF